MGIVTVSIDNEVERKLREKIEDRKGALGEAITEALENWINEDESQKAKEELFQILEEGYEMGEIKYDHRKELHDR